MTEPSTVFHIANVCDVSNPQHPEDYRCASLDNEGFIHCCEQRQLAGVVGRYYQDIDELYLLIVDVDKLDAPLILENTVGGSELFPHVYGAINAAAIIQVLPFGIESAERQGLEA